MTRAEYAEKGEREGQSTRGMWQSVEENQKFLFG
jgi:hypothetical protein